MKLARVIPIFKSGSKSDLSNYRPISILPVFSKALERIIYDRTFKFITKYNILFNKQFGFRKGFNTSLALTDLTNKIVDLLKTII